MYLGFMGRLAAEVVRCIGTARGGGRSDKQKQTLKACQNDGFGKSRNRDLFLHIEGACFTNEYLLEYSLVPRSYKGRWFTIWKSNTNSYKSRNILFNENYKSRDLFTQLLFPCFVLFTFKLEVGKPYRCIGLMTFKI